MNVEEVFTKNAEALSWLYPDVGRRAALVYVEMFNDHGVVMRATETLRSMERQAALYAQGRTNPGKIVTWAKPGDSMHHYGCAFDSCFAGGDPYLEKLMRGGPLQAEALWQAFGEKCEKYGLEWGGTWPGRKLDRPHAQLTYGLKLAKLRELYDAGGLVAVFKTFDEQSAIWPTSKDGVQH